VSEPAPKARSASTESMRSLVPETLSHSCSKLTSVVRPWIRAKVVSPGAKHDPPKPIPACRNFGPMRSSRPIPRATSTTSAPVSSHTLAISLMKEILVARKALEASLTISALATSVRTSGASSGA